MKSYTISKSRFAISGAISGAVAALTFTLIHDIFISDIWFSLALMLVAGGLCGACLGWSFSIMVRSSSLKSWLAYNLIYDTMFLVLALVSLLVFSPTMPMAALMALNGPPDDLIAQALPVTVIFTVIMAVAISAIYGFGWSRLGASLLTSLVLVLLLGLNVSVIGLVSIPRGSWYLVAEMLGLILMLDLAYAAVFVVLERTSLLNGTLDQQRNLV